MDEMGRRQLVILRIRCGVDLIFYVCCQHQKLEDVERSCTFDLFTELSMEAVKELSDMSDPAFHQEGTMMCGRGLQYGPISLWAF